MAVEDALSVRQPRLRRGDAPAHMDGFTFADDLPGVTRQGFEEVHLELERGISGTRREEGVDWTAQPIAESMSVLMMPPCTLPMGL